MPRATSSNDGFTGNGMGCRRVRSSDILALVTLLKSHFKAEAKIDETNVTAIIRNALRVRKNEKADALIGAKYGLTYADFISVGKDKFPPELYRDALSEISSLSLRAEFVIAGFYGNRPFLCETSNDGDISPRTDFAVRGDGVHLATSVLLYRDQTGARGLETTLYSVYEAKKYAQRVPGVGQETTISILSPDGPWKQVGDKGRAYLEEQYEKFGPKEATGLKFDEEFFEVR